MADFSKLQFGAVLVLCLFMLSYSTEGSKATFNEKNYTVSAAPRKLLLSRPHRIWGEKCTAGNIQINQHPIGPLPSGIPAFIVEVMNRCATGCNISNIHLNCGPFSSSQLINPKVFRRLGYNDCLVNDGKSLSNGAILTFTYSNSFSYPLSVSSIACGGEGKIV